MRHRSCQRLPISSKDTPTTHNYTLSLHDALPISNHSSSVAVSTTRASGNSGPQPPSGSTAAAMPMPSRSEEHTSELQSHVNLVCRLLLEKKKQRFQRADRFGG